MTGAGLLAEPAARGSNGAAPDRPTLFEFVSGSDLWSIVSGVSRDPNAKITMLLVSPESGRAVLAVKAPTTDVAARAVDAERRLLLELEALGPRGVIETIPHVVDQVDFEGRAAAVMTAVQGTPMTTSYMAWRHTATPAKVAADFAAVDEWLAGFQRETAQQDGDLDMDGGVTTRLRSRFPDDDELGRDLDWLGEIHSRLRRNTVPRTVVHGDLWFGNLLTTGDRISGVVDWEAGVRSGEPVRDLVRFALAYALYLDRHTRAGRGVRGHRGLRAGSWGAGVQFAIGGAGWFPEVFRRFLAAGLSRLGASADCWRDAALAGIAEVAAFTDDQRFARLHLDLFRRFRPRAPEPKRARRQ